MINRLRKILFFSHCFVSLCQNPIKCYNMKNSIVITPNGVSIQVSVYFFQEGNSRLAYCPSLDLCGYGMTMSDARTDLEYVLNNYIQDQTENRTLSQDLAQHGWNVEDEHRAMEPTFAEIVKRSSQLKRVGNKEFSKRNVRIRQVARV